MIRINLPSFRNTCSRLVSALFLIALTGSAAVQALSANGTFVLTGSPNTARYNHTATLLPNGEVLVVGGLGVNGVYVSLARAELYSPKHGDGRWIVTGSMSVGRTAFTATLLTSGQVLVAGGSDYMVNCYATWLGRDRVFTIL